MKDQAQIVVIGGGIAGSSIAYHLALLGAKDVLLIEKGDGSSPCFKKEEAVQENLQFGLVNRILARFFRR